MTASSTTLFLVAGLLCVVVLFRRRLLAEPPFAFALINFVAYQLPYWLHRNEVPIHAPRMFPEYSESLATFAGISSLCFVGGYYLVNRMPFKRAVRRAHVPRGHSVERQLPAMVERMKLTPAIVSLTIIAFMLIVFQSPGNNPFFYGLERYELAGQGNLDSNPLINVARVVLIPIGLVGAVLCGALLSTNRKLSTFVFVLVCLFVMSLSVVAKFSRGAGGFYLAAAVTLFSAKKRRSKVAASSLLVIGAYLCLIGFYGRGGNLTGVQSFIEVATSPSAVIEDLSRTSSGGYRLPLDGLEIGTVALAANRGLTLEPFDLVRHFWFQVSPVPSALQGVSRPFVLPSEYLGSTSTIGLPIPAMAEVYVLMGAFGSAFFALMGIAYGALLKISRGIGAGLASIVLIAMDVGMILGVHQSMRGFTRPLVLVMSLSIAFGFLRKVNRRHAGPPLRARGQIHRPTSGPAINRPKRVSSRQMWGE